MLEAALVEYQSPSSLDQVCPAIAVDNSPRICTTTTTAAHPDGQRPPLSLSTTTASSSSSLSLFLPQARAHITVQPGTLGKGTCGPVCLGFSLSLSLSIYLFLPVSISYLSFPPPPSLRRHIHTYIHTSVHTHVHTSVHTYVRLPAPVFLT